MAIEFGKPSTNAHIIRSMANTSLLKFEEAVRDLEEASSIDPDSVIIKERLKKAQVELRKSKRVDYYKVLGISEVRVYTLSSLTLRLLPLNAGHVGRAVYTLQLYSLRSYPPEEWSHWPRLAGACLRARHHGPEACAGPWLWVWWRADGDSTGDRQGV